MLKRNLILLLVVVVAVTVWAGGSGSVTSQTVAKARPDLSGNWQLNSDLSDDPAQAMAAMQGDRRGGSESGGYGHGPGHSGGGGAGGGHAGGGRAMIRLLEAPARLTVTQADESITFTDGTGRSQTLTTNGKKEKQPFEDGTAEVKTKWDDGRLVKETKFDDGLNLTETYSLDRGRDQLRVVVKLKGSQMPRELTLNRVYDRERPR